MTNDRRTEEVLDAARGTWSTSVFSALVIGMRLFQQSDVGEGKVASFAFALALPLTVHVDLGHCHKVPHLQSDKHNP